MTVPAKVLERIKTSIKRFQPTLSELKKRDINESDTVRVVTDMLENIFGYDKYSEITSEYSIRGTYCDLAIKLDGKIALLIEVKAIGIELKDPHVRQAINYAANEGVEWVALTNGIEWRIYKVNFGKPINYDLIEHFDLQSLSIKDKNAVDIIALLTKEGIKKSKLEQHHSYKQILNRFTIASLILSESVVDTIRREIRRISSDAKISENELREILVNEVLKREVLEGDKATHAKKLVSKSEKNSLRKIKIKETDPSAPMISMSEARTGTED